MLNIRYNRIYTHLFLGLFFVLCFCAFTPFAHADGFMEFLDGSVIKWMGWLVYALALGIGGLFIGMGGLALDLMIKMFVIQMGDWFNGGYGLGIIQVWQIIRDVFNILFIFSFIYIGIRTILNSEDSGTRRALGHLIVAALFINFSLVITQAIVDFSNIAATQIYNQIIAGGISGLNAPDIIETGPNSVAGAFLQISDLTTFFGSNNLLNDLSGSKIIVYSILMMIFFILAGIVFLFAAFHLLYRFVALSIYMILSPVLFLGLILPKFQGYTDKWVSGLLKQSFFAPAFLFLIYVSLMALSKLKEQLEISAGGDYSIIKDGATMSVDGFTIFIFFGIVIGFLYASIRVGEMMSIAGASTAMKTVQNARKTAQGVLYRNTAGRSAELVRKGYDRMDRAAKEGNRAAWVGRSLMGGESGRRGLETATKYGAGGRGLEDRRTYLKEKENARTERILGSNDKKALYDAVKAGTEGAPSATQKIAMESALAGASAGDLVKLGESKEGFQLLQTVTANLPQKKFESLMDSKDLTPEQKEKLGSARRERVESIITQAGAGGQPVTTPAQQQAAFQKGIMGASPDQLDAIEFNKLMDNALYVQGGQIEKLESKWGEEKMRLFKGKREEDILQAFRSNTPSLVINSRKGDKEIAKLPTKVFTQHTSLLLDELIANGKLNGGLMQSIATDSGMSGAERKTFGSAVKARYGNQVPSDLTSFFNSGMGAAFN